MEPRAIPRNAWRSSLIRPSKSGWISGARLWPTRCARWRSMRGRSTPKWPLRSTPTGLPAEIAPGKAAIDHPRLLTSTDVFWTEEPNPAQYLPDGRLVSKIRSYKLARAFKNILLAYIADSEVAMAEGLAFNQTLGFAGMQNPMGGNNGQACGLLSEESRPLCWC